MTTSTAYATAKPGHAPMVRPRRSGRTAYAAMRSPARTKAKLLHVLTGCSIQPAEAALQKLEPRPTSGPSHPPMAAATNSPSDRTATLTATTHGRADLVAVNGQTRTG